MKSSESLKIRDLPKLAFKYELSKEFVAEITGINLNHFRRGKLDPDKELAADAVALLRRIETVFELGVRITGDESKTVDWLYENNPTIGGKAPIDLAESPDGVERLRFLVSLLGPT